MRNYLIGVLIFIGVLLAIPLIVVSGKSDIKKATAGYEKSYNPVYIDNVKIYDCLSGEITELSIKDYLIGSVFAQIPADFDNEAIKAQVIISHTYISRQHAVSLEQKNEELRGADISSDTRIYQPYYTKEQAIAVYKESYDFYYNKISECVDEVADIVITYDNELIVPSFHSMSGGMTESAENLWGVSVPYLVSVDSGLDMMCEGFSDTVSMTKEEMEARLTQGLPGVNLDENPENWIVMKKVSEAGSPLIVTVGGNDFLGSEIKKLLSVRSSFYSITYNGDLFIIEVKGYGHGVGLSQYGAQSMSLTGSNYQDILKHYYTGTELTQIKKESAY